MPASQTSSAALQLRPARPEDDGFLFRLFAESQQQLAALLGDEALGRSLVEMQYRGRKMSWAAQYPDAADSILIADDGTPVGRFLVDRKPDRWRIVDIAVLARIAAGDWEHACLRSAGASAGAAGARLELRVAPDNPARRLYERLGFRVTGQDAVAVEMVWNAAGQDRRDDGSE